MKFEDTIQGKLKGAQTFKSIGNENTLTLTDPITQLCKRIEAFFKADEDISCRFVVNNNKHTGAKIDPGTGEPYTKLIDVGGEQITAVVDEDHFCEFRVFVKSVEKAQCLSNVIRHRHTLTETYEAASDGQIHIRNHYLLVRVCTIDAVDPDGQGGGSNPWITDDDTDSGIKEIFGLEPINWNDSKHSGCNERLAPSDNSGTDIPSGVPDEYEQQQWEKNSGGLAWKWIWLKNALKGNKNIVNTYGLVDAMTGSNWLFVECSYIPVVFQEDNLTSSRGFNSILAADLLPLIFSVFNKIQISTYVRK